MTPEARLTQAEKLLETTPRYINRYAETLEQHDREMSHLSTTLDRTLETFGELVLRQV